MQEIRVVVQTSDPITSAGLTSYLHSRRGLTVVQTADQLPDVVVVMTDRLNFEATDRLRRLAAEFDKPTVLLTGELNEASLLTAVEHHVVAILPRNSATSEQLVDSVQAAAIGNGVMPRDVLGQLLRRLESLQREVLAPNGLNASGLQPREVDILRLMAEGWDTEEIAKELKYSVRTVKNVIYNLTARLRLRNRAHAVAYAMRSGAI
jgi:DNA-binding NarL/FixJ family response regulator